MFIDQAAKSVTFGFRMGLDEFPRLLTRHARRFPGAYDLETFASFLRREDFPLDETADFVRQVCKWGGSPWVGGRVLGGNQLAHIRHSLRQASEVLDEDPPDLVKALFGVNELKMLGSPAFASRHLRFLRPDLCPVFDEALRRSLPYTFDPYGYREWANDCQFLATLLNDRMGSTEGPWRVADVEAAVLMKHLS